MKTNLIPVIFLSLTAGCATAPQAPPEPPISIELRGTSVEVQHFIEDRLRGRSGFRIEAASDRAITFKALCTDLPNMSVFQCAAIMMTVGNSGWSGPYSVVTFRTAEIRGTVNLTVASEWCATNVFGKTNCVTSGSNADANDLLRKINQAYPR